MNSGKRLSRRCFKFSLVFLTIRAHTYCTGDQWRNYERDRHWGRVTFALTRLDAFRTITETQHSSTGQCVSATRRNRKVLEFFY